MNHSDGDRKRGDKPLWAPREYPATNLILARNRRASTASFVDKFGINRQDCTAFSIKALELDAGREGELSMKKSQS